MTKLILFFFLALPVFAQTPTPATTAITSEAPLQLSAFESELDINLSGGFYRKYKDAAGTEHTESNIQLAYLQNFRTPFQFGGAAGLYGIDSKSYLTLYVTGVANLVPDYTNSFYVSGSVGAKTIDQTNEVTLEVTQKANFYGQLTLGRRINIRKHLSYKPFIAVSKAGNLTPEYSIHFINFSINW